MHFAILTTNSTIQCKVISKAGKKAIANAHDGFIKQCKAQAATDFLNVLNGLKQNESIILGTPHKPDGTALNVGEVIELTTKTHPKSNAIPRTKEHLKNISQEGFLLFDMDDGGTYDDLLAAFPELDGVGAVVVPSSSSFIFNADGSVHTGAKGWHIYIHVLNMSDAERIGNILWGKMWLKGYGSIKISNGIHPAMLERGLWDKCVLGAPERLAFEASPILHDGLTRDVSQHRRAIDGCAFDTEKVADLTAYEKKEIAELIKKAKAEKEPERKKALIKAKKLFIEKSEKSGASKAEASRNWEMIGRQQLPHDFILYTENGEREAGSLNADDDGLVMADPNEPDYHGGAFKARYYWNDGRNPQINSFARGGLQYTIAPHPDDWKTALMLHVILFNQNHAQVLLGGKHRIVRESIACEPLEFIEQKELEKAFQNDEIKTGEKTNSRGEIKDIYANKVKAWAEHPECRVYRNSVIFSPNAPEKEGVYNTWRGFSVKPIEADGETKEKLKLIKDHIDKVVCAGDPALIKYFFNWCAYTFQKPEKQAGAVVVLVGEKGTGKGILGHFLRNIWGAHGKHISNPRHLVGNFNAHLENVCFLFADEAFYAGDKASENVLKSIVTEPTISIERKGFDVVSQKNCLKIFMATNNEKAVPASSDERRYCVFNVSNSRRGDRAYFDALHDAIQCPAVQAAFLYEMLALDLTGFHTGDIPESDGLKEQRLQSLCSVGQWFFDCLYRGSVRTADGNNTSWEQFMSINLLYTCYINWCDQMRISEYHRSAAHILGRYLSKLGFESDKKRDGMVRNMKSWDEAVMAFEFHEKIDVPRRRETATAKNVKAVNDGEHIIHT